jgi:hypothetical protein
VLSRALLRDVHRVQPRSALRFGDRLRSCERVGVGVRG